MFWSLFYYRQIYEFFIRSAFKGDSLESSKFRRVFFFENGFNFRRSFVEETLQSDHETVVSPLSFSLPQALFQALIKSQITL